MIGIKSVFILNLILFATLLVSCNQGLSSDYKANRDAGPRHVRILWTEDPSQQAIVSWTTLFERGEDHVVFYDTVPRSGNTSAYAFRMSPRKTGQVSLTNLDRKANVPPGYFHHAEMRDLKPSTRYYFTVQTDGSQSEEFYFITAPADDREFSMIWGGDSRRGSSKDESPHLVRQQMNSRIKALLEDYPDILAFNHGADYTSNSEWRYLFWWFEDHEIVKGGDNRLLPLIISRGNHDMEIGFEENFWLGDIIAGSGKEYYYSTKLSPKVKLLTLNTETSMAGNQKEWLRQVLENSRDSSRWVLANYHRPAYPAVKDPEDPTSKMVRQHWVPLFEDYGVDLVMEADGHILKRTVPILDNRMDENGVVYIGEGGLGVPQRIADTSRWFIRQPGFAASADNVHVLTFGKDSLKATAYGMNGEVLDHYSRSPRNQE